MRLAPLAGLATLATLAALIGACGGTREPAQAPPDARGCCVFVDTARLPGDFVWRQRIGVSYRERQESFQAVLEKQGNRLVLLALTPFGTRAFALEQVGVTVSYTPFMDLELPFPPKYILADVHRTFFRGLPEPTADGVYQGEADGERITERWENGRLMRREYLGPNGDASGSIVIDYVGGMRDGTPSGEIHFDNRRYGYALTITTLQARPN